VRFLHSREEGGEEKGNVFLSSHKRKEKGVSHRKKQKKNKEVEKLQRKGKKGPLPSSKKKKEGREKDKRLLATFFPPTLMAEKGRGGI